MKTKGWRSNLEKELTVFCCRIAIWQETTGGSFRRAGSVTLLLPRSSARDDGLHSKP